MIGGQSGNPLDQLSWAILDPSGIHVVGIGAQAFGDHRPRHLDHSMPSFTRVWSAVGVTQIDRIWQDDHRSIDASHRAWPGTYHDELSDEGPILWRDVLCAHVDDSGRFGIQPRSKASHPQTVDGRIGGPEKSLGARLKVRKVPAGWFVNMSRSIDYADSLKDNEYVDRC